MSLLRDWMARYLGGGPALSAAQQQRLVAWQALPRSDLGQAADRSRWVVVDVETSGLNLLEDKLISIGAVAVVNGRIALGDSFSVVLQQRTVSEHSNILLHGIGSSAQREGVPAADALLDFLDYLGASPLVAFHVTFDETMIRRAMRDHLGLNFRHPWLDLAYVMPALYPPLAKRYRALDDWTQAFDIRIDARHDALADALATAQLLQIAAAQAGRKGIASYQGLRDLEKNQRWVNAVS